MTIMWWGAPWDVTNYSLDHMVCWLFCLHKLLLLSPYLKWKYEFDKDICGRRHQYAATRLGWIYGRVQYASWELLSVWFQNSSCFCGNCLCEKHGSCSIYYYLGFILFCRMLPAVNYISLSLGSVELTLHFMNTQLLGLPYGRWEGTIDRYWSAKMAHSMGFHHGMSQDAIHQRSAPPKRFFQYGSLSIRKPSQSISVQVRVEHVY